MTQESQTVEKVYEEFIVEHHNCSLIGLKQESGELVFEGVNFNSGTLSFSDDYINCSEGTKKLKKFSITDTEIEINYKSVSKFKFIDCKFSNDIFFKRNLASLKFEKCAFEGRCYINNQYEADNVKIEINDLEIKKTVFQKNFKLHNTVIGCFKIVDTDFIENADFFKSVFDSGYDNKISFHAINFHKLALFGDTQFKQLLQFKYVTFRGYSQFRSASFYKGLDLEYANIEKEMNFFDVKKLDSRDSKKNTSQETYRIIKHQLQKTGNIISSNKYHSLELSKRRQKLSFYSFDYLVLLIHWGSSNHSQSWLLPLIWIFAVGSFTCWGVINTSCEDCFYQIENIFKYVSIFSLDDGIKKHPIIFVLNKISLGYLYYQFVTAIRKDTRK